MFMKTCPSTLAVLVSLFLTITFLSGEDVRAKTGESVPGNVTAAPVAVSIPGTSLAPGSNVSVPVTVGDLTGRGVISFDFEVRFDPAYLRPVTATPTTKTGTLSNGFMITANPNLSGRLLVSGFSAYPISGAGTLLILNFEVISQTPSAPVSWHSFMFNEGDPPASLSVGATTVSTGPVPVSMPVMTVEQGSAIKVPVTTGNVTGRNVISFDFEVNFNSSVIRPSSVSPVTKVATIASGFYITVNSSIPGRLIVSGFSAYPLEGTGTLLELNFESTGPGGQVSPINFRSFWYNEGDPLATTTNGQVTVTGAVAMRPTPFDFDGDGKADTVVFRPGDRNWYRSLSSQGLAITQFGLSTDKVVPADYDGDGKTDIAVYRNGVWYWINSSSQTVSTRTYGISTDLPVPADFSGDGRAEIAVFRDGVWYTLDLATNQTGIQTFGMAGDRPVVADYDGDRRSDIAIYRNGEWHLNQSTAGYAVANFGLSTDRPVSGDFDGDGKADLAVFRRRMWFINASTDGYANYTFGLFSDIPVPADYDGDGRTDVAVFRSGTWHVQQSRAGYTYFTFGTAADLPIAAAFNY